MKSIHSAEAAGVKFKYHDPQSSDKGPIKGIMYQKADSKTGEMKLKSANGFMERLMLKARGYSKLTEGNAKKFLQASLTHTNLPLDIDLTSRIKSSGQSKSVIKTEVFHSNFNSLKATDIMTMNIKSILQ